MLAEPVPLVIRNAPTRLMKELHYGEGYQYAHDTPGQADHHAVPARFPSRAAATTGPPTRAARPGLPSVWNRSKSGNGTIAPRREPGRKSFDGTRVPLVEKAGWFFLSTYNEII